MQREKKRRDLELFSSGRVFGNDLLYAREKLRLGENGSGGKLDLGLGGWVLVRIFFRAVKRGGCWRKG